MIKVLISAPYLIMEFNEYKDIFERNNMDVIIPKVNERLDEDDLIEQIQDIDGVICGDDKFTKKVIDKAKKLKIIVKWGTGIDSIDKGYAEKKGIKVFNTPGAFTEPVSDTVMAYVLAFSRGIFELDRLMKKGKWQKVKGKALNELSIGIIGVGNVGSAVARKAKAFGMKIYGNDIKKVSDKIIRMHTIEMVELNYLLKHSDFISVNCDLNPSSYHLINIEKLKLIKKTTILINTARGPIIKEDDLIYALNNNLLTGVALDVFEKEPLPINSPLRSMHNVLLAPHNANSSYEYWKKVHENSINILLKYLKEVI
jgi:D-3-phosphoglycerate dehydrogenase